MQGVHRVLHLIKDHVCHGFYLVWYLSFQFCFGFPFDDHLSFSLVFIHQNMFVLVLLLFMKMKL